MSGFDAAVRTIGLVHQLEPKLSELKKATDGFETIFIKNLVGQMRKGFKQISLGENPGGDVYQDFADQALSESLSQKHVLGIGNMLYKSFSPKLVELERQRLTAEARSGLSSLPPERRWILGPKAAPIKTSGPKRATD